MTHTSPNWIVDFDSTAVTVESLDEFGKLALEGAPDREARCAELQAITARGMNGEMPFDASLAARLTLFQAHRSLIPRLNERLAGKLSPSAVEHKDWFEENAERIYIVSGGFEEFIIPTVAHLGVLATNVYANRFTFDDKDNITGYDPARLTSQPGGKAAQVKALELEGYTIAVGDAYTDLEIRMAGAADEFWVCTETVYRPGIVTAANHVVSDLRELV